MNTADRWVQAREKAVRMLERDGRYHRTPYEFYSIRVGAKILHDEDTAKLADKVADYLVERES